MRTERNILVNSRIMRLPQGNNLQLSPRRLALALFAACMVLMLAGSLAAQASLVPHDVAAGNMTVAQYPGWTSGNDNTNIVLTLSLGVNDFRAGTYNRGDYNVQIGSTATDDSQLGILITSVAQNIRTQYGTNNYCTSGIDTNSNAAYRILSFTHGPTADASLECNVNVAGAWFPYSSWLGGFARTSPYTNAYPNNLLTASAGMKNWNEGGTYTNFWDYKGIAGTPAGRFTVDLTSFGVDSRTDGVLLVNHGKDEANYALSQVNSDNGTWTVFIHDNYANGGSYEHDPVAFVFVPRTNTMVVSGRFKADTTGLVDIDMYSGASPQFTVSYIAIGRWTLKMNHPDYTPANGVLIVSLEGGYSYNQDNIATYEPNAAGDGWEINSRDGPNMGLQSPAPGAPDAVCSFVYIPALPGFIFSTTNAAVNESGTATNVTVALAYQPTADVTINLTSSDTSEATLSPSSLTFTPANWATPQTFTVTGVNDFVMDGDIEYSIVTTVSSSDSAFAAVDPFDIAVTTLDNEAALALPSGTKYYGIGDPAVGLDGAVVLTDPYTAAYNGVTLTVAITANGSADDRLAIRDDGVGMGLIGVSGSSVTYGGTTIGTFTGGSGITPLVVTFNAAASGDAAQALLRAVTYRTVSASPSPSSRTVTVTLAHTDGGTSTTSEAVQIGIVRACDFQAGADCGYGVYQGAVDVEIDPSNPNTSYPIGTTSSGMWIDYVGSSNPQVLLGFTNIFGTGPGQIPSGATIVSAQLILNVNDSGHGARFHRMLTPWNPDAETWNTLGGGVQQDDADSCSTNAAFWGLPDEVGLVATGTGQSVIGVTTDVQLWANGHPNCGWVALPWDAGDNGLGWSACEDATVTNRPRLHVVWVPAGTQMASYQQGVNGYASAYDTSIRQNTPDISRATDTSAFSDWAVSGASDNEQLLIRFDSIIGSAASQIPNGATVYAAVLDLTGDVDNAPGDGGLFYAMLEPWQDTDTWTTLGGIQANGVKAATTASASAGYAARNPNVQATVNTIDLTTDVQAWVSGTRANYGWVVLPWTDGTDGWGVSTAQATNPGRRPQLRVYYSDDFLTNTWSPDGSLACNVTNAAGTPGAGYSALYLAGHLDIQATAGNPYTIDLTAYSGDTLGHAANWSCDSTFTWTIATTTRGVLNFDAAKFAVDTSQFANDLAGGTFTVTTSGNNVQVVFAPNSSPVASPASYAFAKGVSFKPFNVPIGSFLADRTADADGDTRVLVSVTSTNATVSTNASDITITSTNGVAESIQYVIKDVRNYRAGDTLRMATNYIHIVRTNSVGTATISNLGGTNMAVSFYGIPGYQYVIQRSPDMSEWADVITNGAASNGLVQFTETPPYNPAFYRIRTE